MNLKKNLFYISFYLKSSLFISNSQSECESKTTGFEQTVLQPVASTHQELSMNVVQN